MIAAMLMMLALGGAQAKVQESDPLAPSREGKYVCQLPDRAARTCATTISYAPIAGGGYRTTTTLVLSRNPWTTMITHADLTVSGNTVCEVYLPENFDSGQVLIDGEPASEDVSTAWKTKLKDGLTDFEERNVCSTYRDEGDLISTSVTLDGVPQAGWGTKMIWVLPSEGYKLR